MNTYQYQAVDETGRQMSGTISADGPQPVRSSLRLKGLYVTRIRATGRSRRFSLRNTVRRRLPVSSRDRIDFLRGLSLSLRSGTPLHEALANCRDDARHPRFAASIERLKRAVEFGLPLSRALAMTGHCCELVTTRLVEAAESSGQLCECLERATASLEHRSQTRRKLMSAAVYPAFTAFLTFCVALGLIFFLLPTMQEVFVERQLELPASAEFLLRAGASVRQNAPQLGALIVTAVAMAYAAYKAPRTGRQFDAFLLQCPVIGNVLAARIFGQASDVLSLLLDNHVRLGDALRTVSTLSSNRAVTDCLKHATQQLANGQLPGEVLQRSRVMSPAFTQAFLAGERSGSLSHSLRAAAANFEHQLDVHTRTLTGMLEPALVLGVGSILGFLFYAAYEAMTNFALSSVPGVS